MDAASWYWISESVRYISTAVGVIGFTWAVAWLWSKLS